MEVAKKTGGRKVEESFELQAKDAEGDGVGVASEAEQGAVGGKAEASERGAIVAPFGEFCAKELAARKVRRIMGIC